MSTRQLFSVSDRPAGVAGKCDWVILEPGVVLGDENTRPRSIFIAMRAPYLHGLLMYFYEVVLPLIENRFVLITASGDITLPLQLDLRFRQYAAIEASIIETIRKDDRVIAWFTENLSAHVDKMFPIPCGVNPNEYDPDLIWKHATALNPVGRKTQKVLCLHRTHNLEPQMHDRMRVSQLAAAKWKSLCVSPDRLLPYQEYFECLSKYQFIFCVHGGGIDPSPKAWEAILLGAIPIIQHSTLDEAYAQLPVAFVDDWDEDAVSSDMLRKWREELLPYYDDPALRSQVMHKLSLNYWWEKISCRL